MESQLKRKKYIPDENTKATEEKNKVAKKTCLGSSTYIDQRKYFQNNMTSTHSKIHCNFAHFNFNWEMLRH